MANIGPQLPPHLLKQKDHNADDEIGPRLPSSNHLENSNKGNIGPQLPPSLMKPSEKEDEDEELVTVQDNLKSTNYGPALPPGFGQKVNKFIGPAMPHINPDKEESSDEEEIVGPALPSGDSAPVKSIEEEYEARALAMKNKLNGKPDDGKMQRENWMLELPPELSKNFGLGPRTFRTKAPELGDRSVWTDTPADKERKIKERQEAAMKAAGEKRKSADTKREPATKEELEMKERVEEYNKATRPKSLLEMHQDKRKKTEPETSTARRPFDRDRDLNIKRTDPKATAKFIKDAQGFNSKFSKGSYEKKFL